MHKENVIEIRADGVIIKKEGSLSRERATRKGEPNRYRDISSLISAVSSRKLEGF